MSIFGASAGGSGGLFGGNTSTAGGQANTTANQPSLFGNKPAASGGLFGAAQNPTSGGTSGETKSGLFGGGSTNIAGTAPTTTSIFGSGAAPTGSAPPSLFANTGASSTGSGTTSTNPSFGGSFFSKPADQNASNATKPAGTSPFGQPSTSTGTVTAAPAPTTSGGLFGQPAKPADSTPRAITSSSSLFGGGLFGKPAAAGTATLSTTVPSASIGGLSTNSGVKPAEKKDGVSAAPTPAPSFNLFGSTKSAEEKKDTSASTSGPTTSLSLGLAKSADTAVSNTQAAPTTVTVAVAPPSMLRGKTIEEIVNKWSLELETHVREFNKFASEVAVWDRALIENGNNLSALYNHVQSAERDQNDIDQSLDHIEQQQKELASTLDAYEKVTQEIVGSQGGGLRALDTGPADTERDKNYMLATDLHTHLDDLSGSLTQMIDSVNAMSLTSSDSAPSEDPMSQIAQILSSHLESLQWIDGAVREVESKVTEVEKRTRDSGYSAPGASQQNRGFGLN